MADYENWTKEALIERLYTLEAQIKTNDNSTEPKAIAPLKTDPNQPNSPTKTEQKNKRRNDKFNFSSFPQRKVAFKFSYLGWQYHGLARQGNALMSEDKRVAEEQYPTVEGELFKALYKCRLIESEAECGYSRCGRTDRGVSGFGQVVSLYVRSTGKFLSDEECSSLEADEINSQNIVRYEKNGGRAVLLPEDEKEFPYINMLNKALPQEIRILAWSPVKPEFDARFSCKGRFYRYFFNEEGLDISAMRDAASRYVGTHDFRNFCRLDPAKQIKNFERTVMDISINSVPSRVSFVGDAQDPSGRWWQLELRGTAFLWHQVRCMMAILFLVGQGLEEPSIVDKLLDIEATPGKPEFEMASDLPLVLADCTFDKADIKWKSVKIPDQELGNMVVLDRVLSQQWGELNTRAVISSALLENLHETHVPTSRVAGAQLQSWREYKKEGIPNTEKGTKYIVGGGRVKRIRKYIPMMQRKQADSVESRNMAWLERKGCKRTREE